MSCHLRIPSIVLAAIMSVGVSAVFAQTSTLPAPHIPSGCYARPASILSVLDALNRAEQYWEYGYGMSGQSVELSSLVRGESLTQEDQVGIEETLYQLVACANAVSPLQVLGLLSTEYQALLAVQIVDEDNFDTVASHIPMLATQTADLEGIAELTVIDAWYEPGTNKIIHAVVEPYIAEGGQSARFLVTFQWDTDTWTISYVSLIE